MHRASSTIAEISANALLPKFNQENSRSLWPEPVGLSNPSFLDTVVHGGNSVRIIVADHRRHILAYVEQFQCLDPFVSLEENTPQTVPLEHEIIEDHYLITPNFLPSNVEFSPSIALTEFWIDGIKFVRESASLNITDIAVLTDIDIQSLRKLFSDRLYLEIISHLQNSRADNKCKQLVLLEDGISEPWLELLLSNSFEIRPRSMDQFIQTAERELSQHFFSATLNGDWGKIVVSEGNVLAELLPAPAITVRNRNSAEIDI